MRLPSSATVLPWTFAPERFACDESPLLALDAGVWNDFVFCRRTASPANVLLDGMPPWLKTTDLRHVVRAFTDEWTTHANWKLCCENFQESHHFARVHRALEALTRSADASSWLGGGRWLGGIMRIEGAETVSVDGSRHGRPLLVPPSSLGTVFDAMLFPSLLTSLQPDYLLTYRLIPLAAGRTRIVADTYFHPAALGLCLS